MTTITKQDVEAALLLMYYSFYADEDDISEQLSQFHTHLLRHHEKVYSMVNCLIRGAQDALTMNGDAPTGFDAQFELALHLLDHLPLPEEA